MSEHICEVVPVNLESHPNADLLSIARIRGWQCVVKTDEFKNQPLGIYIPIDMVVPDTEEWKWLENRRVKTHKFRGAISQGLLIPAQRGMRIGDDVTEQLGVTRYVPKLPGNKNGVRCGENIPPPAGMVKYFDIENWKNHTNVFNEEDTVVVTEKIHGANARFALLNGQFYVGSHNTVRKPIPPEPTSWFGKKVLECRRKFGFAPLQRKPDEWQKVADRYGIEAKMRSVFGAERDVILFAEIYGPHIQPSLPYGVPVGETRAAFFDIMSDGRYVDFLLAKEYFNDMVLPCVPELKVMQFGPKVFEMVDGPAFVGNHIREGIVVRSWPDERHDLKLGRKVIKLISEKYLLKDYEEAPDDDSGNQDN